MANEPMTKCKKCGHNKNDHKWFVQIGNHPKQFYHKGCRKCKCEKFEGDNHSPGRNNRQRIRESLSRDKEPEDKSLYEHLDSKSGSFNLSKQIFEIVLFGEVVHAKDVKEKIQNAQKRLKDDLDYWDGQPVTSEFSRGFQHCCFIFKQRIDKIFLEEFGKKLI